jgi:hypothetical protein
MRVVRKRLDYRGFDCQRAWASRLSLGPILPPSLEYQMVPIWLQDTNAKSNVSHPVVRGDLPYGLLYYTISYAKCIKFAP